jgi:hypothetical protein
MEVPPTSLDAVIAAAIGAVRRRIGSPQPQLEATLEQALRTEVGFAGDDFSAAWCDRLVESLTIQALYPDEFVAFRDSIVTEDGERRLRREVLHHTSDALAISTFVCGLGANNFTDVVVEYQPRAGFCHR